MTKLSNINEYQFKVDSTRLSIPLRNCEITNSDLTDYYVDITINKTTGEQKEIKSYKNAPFHQVYEDGTSVKIWITSQITYDKNHSYNEDYITFLINSKHSHEGYWNGINKDNFIEYYNYFMSLNNFKCSYVDFCKARYTDLDICLDFRCTESDFKHLKKNVNASVKDSSKWHSVSKEDNSGIWAPTKKEPRKQCTPSAPFVKFYSKEKDFKYNSTQFAETYLKPEQYQDIVRFECNIINSEHKRRLGLNKFPTIISLLNADLKNISQQIFKEYFMESKYIDTSGLRGKDKLLMRAVNLAISKGCSDKELYNIFDSAADDRTTRHRFKELYQKLYANDEFKRKQMKANSVTKNIFDALGMDSIMNE